MTTSSISTVISPKPGIHQPHAKLPVLFVPNTGQVDSKVLFYSHGYAPKVYFTSEEAIFLFAKKRQQLSCMVLAFRFINSNPDVKVEGFKECDGRINYFKGKDPSNWHTNIRTFSSIVYRELWTGIDLVFHEVNGQLKYEFLLKPGAEPNAIRLSYDGCDNLSTDDAGHLEINTEFGVITDAKPYCYQEINGKEVPVGCRFILEEQETGNTLFGFQIEDEYDPDYPLIIDPGLTYSTYLGGGELDQSNGIAVDSFENAYVTGTTTSSDFPITTGAYDTSYNGNGDVFVARFFGRVVLRGVTFSLDKQAQVYISTHIIF